jgi:spermidine/putrescine transport system substrate-binding protein
MKTTGITKRIFFALLIPALLISTLLLFSGCSDDRPVLNVYNWGEFISDKSGDINIIKAFEEEYNIRVNYSTYATNEELYAKLRGGGANYDVIFPSDYMIARLIEEDMLEKLNFDNIPNYSYIMDEFKYLEFDPDNEYSAPYMWGTVVLIYNSRHVTKPVESWDILWDEDYRGRIIMFNNSRDAFGIALKRLGYSINTTDTGELERAAAELQKQKPLVQGYYMDEIFNKMGSGEAWLAPYYAGDALTMIADNPDLAAVFPKEGTNRFIDSMCVPKGARNKEAAEKFINFMLRPDIAAANSEFIGYSTPNSGAYELLSEELRNNPVAYPGAEILANTETFMHLPAEINAKIDDLWKDIRGASGNPLVFPLLLGSLVILCVVIIIIGKNKKKKKQQEY